MQCFWPKCPCQEITIYLKKVGKLKMKSDTWSGLKCSSHFSFFLFFFLVKGKLTPTIRTFWLHLFAGFFFVSVFLSLTLIISNKHVEIGLKRDENYAVGVGRGSCLRCRLNSEMTASPWTCWSEGGRIHLTIPPLATVGLFRTVSGIPARAQ